jgi:hypothetical protein
VAGLVLIQAGWTPPRGAGVRVFQQGADGYIFCYEYGGLDRGISFCSNVGIGTATPKADNKLEVNGKIAATSLNLESATIQKSVTAQGALTVEKDTTFKGPIKIDGNNTLEFGAGISDKQVAAGKIGYQVFAAKDALDIVGAGTADGKQPRKIKFWAEGGAALAGSLNVSGAVNGEKPPYVFEIGNKADTTNWHAVQVPSDIIKSYLGDADGGKIKLLFRVNSTDEVRVITESPCQVSAGSLNVLDADLALR